MTLFRLSRAKTPQIKDSSSKGLSNSISTLEKIKIGGVDQTFLVRGYDANNPILLFLHGGPGLPEIPLAFCTQNELEKHFIMVNWDQRGAGKSYSKKISSETLNLEQFIDDAYELIHFFLKRYIKEKIYLIGHSWGSILGLLLVQRYPELFYAYIGMGQVINPKEGEKMAYQFVLESAKKAGNIKVVSKLEKDPPPYGDDFKRLRFIGKWIARYGGNFYGKKSQWILIKKILKSPEYSLRDIFKLIKGLLNTLKIVWKYMLDINFFEEAPELKVPVYFFEGRHDYQVPFPLVEKYFDKLIAPRKKLIWFENSSHSPNIEETEKYQQALISIVLPETSSTIQ